MDVRVRVGLTPPRQRWGILDRRTTMRRVIQRTITTTKIVSLNMTTSESEEAIEYTLTGGPAQLDAPAAPAELTPDIVPEDGAPLSGTPDDFTATALTDNQPALDHAPTDRPPA